MIEKTAEGEEPLTQVREAEQIFANLLQGLRENQPGFDYQGLKDKVEREFAELELDA